MNKAFELGKWMYSGLLGVALVLAGLISQIQAPLNSNPLPIQNETIAETKESKKLDKEDPSQSTKPETTSKFSSLSKAQSEIDQAFSWNELRSFPSQAYRDFVQQIAQEEFENGQPFVITHQRHIWKKVLGKGLKDYSRKVYRSPYFQSRSGYDLIHYELLLGDGSKAYLLAFREKTEDMQVIVGGEDLRPTRIDFYTEGSETEAWRLESYLTSGEKIFSQEFDQEQFVASRQAIVNLSVPLLTAGQ